MDQDPHSACARAWLSALEVHADAWWSYALHLAGRHDDAEDLVHTMIASVLERGVQPSEVAPGYPYRVMRNAWVSDARKRTAARRHAPRLVRTDHAAALADDRLGAALDALPDEQREVVLLKHRGGLTLEQIALATDRPLGTVAGQLRRAMQALRERLTTTEETAR